MSRMADGLEHFSEEGSWAIEAVYHRLQNCNFDSSQNSEQMFRESRDNMQLAMRLNFSDHFKHEENASEASRNFLRRTLSLATFLKRKTLSIKLKKA